jgi:surface glycoprotein (TIGR04207 family)/PGF-CTERM protein
MTQYTAKLRAVFLTALMIGSVFGAGIAFTGNAVAADSISGGADNDNSIKQTSTFSTDPLTEEDTKSNFKVVYTVKSQNGTGNTDTATVTFPNEFAKKSAFSANSAKVEDKSGNNPGIDSSIELIDGPDNDGVQDTFEIKTSPDSDNDLEVRFDLAIQAPTVSQDTDYTVTTRYQDGPEGSSGGADVSKDFTLTVQDTGASDTGIPGNVSALEAISYNDNGEKIEVSFSEAAFNPDGSSLTKSDVTLYVNGETVTIDNFVETNAADDGQLLIATSASIDPSDTVKVDFGTVEDSAGTEVDVGNVSVDIAATTLKLPTSDATDDPAASISAYEGEEVAVVFTDGYGEDASYERWEDSRFQFSGSTERNSEVILFDTSGENVSATQRFLADEDTSTSGLEEAGIIELRDLGMSATADDTNITTDGTISGSITSNAAGRTVHVDLLDADGNSVEDTTITLDGSGTGSFSFQVSNAGDYTVEATDVDTGISQTTDTITVQSAATATAGFETSQLTVDRGDIELINVTLTNSDTATVTFGGNDVNYVSDFMVKDNDGDGLVVVEVNTYVSGSDRAGKTFTARGSDSVTINNESTLPAPLGTGTYDLSVREGDDPNADADELGTFTVRQRSTGDMQIWTAPAGASDVLESVSQDDTIAKGDYVVHEVGVSGIYGLLENESGDNATAKFANAFSSSKLGLMVNQTKASTGPNESPKTVDISASINNDALTVVTMPTEETVYIVAQPDKFVFSDGSTGADAGDVYTATFSVKPSSDLLTTAESAAGQFEVVEVTHELTYDGDQITVNSAANQTISGETSLAPGTTFSVRVQSDQTSGEPFILNDQEVVVQADGTFTAELDFSEAAVNSTFTASLRHGGTQVDSAPGKVVEMATTTTTTEETTTTTTQTTTTEETTTEETTTEETTTEATTTEPTPTSTTTEGDGGGGGIPGFGIGLALVAVLGAALLALRD